MEKKAQNRLMILGSLFELSRLVRMARERGYYTVVVDGYADGPARTFADASYVEDVRNIDAIADICKKEKIDHIITSFSDIMFECMIKIADRAGIPHYISIDMLDAYRKKDVMKQICRELEIPVPRFRLLQADFADEEAADFRFPAIVKPNDSYGSRGISVVYSIQEIRDMFSRSSQFSSGETVMLEEISRGQELNCMAFVLDGRVQLISMSDRMTQQYASDHIPINYAQHYPSTVLAQAKPLVEDILQRFVNYTGQKEGPISTQCFFDGERVEVCEIAGRMFGFEHELVGYYSGLDIEKLLLDLEYDTEAMRNTLQNHNVQGDRFAYGIYLTSIREGIVTDQSLLRKAALPAIVKEHVFFYDEGERCEHLGPKPYFARYYLVADRREDVEEAEKEVLQTVGAKGRNGEELLFIPTGSTGMEES